MSVSKSAIFITIISFLILGGIIIFGNSSATSSAEFLRIHIRANSNSQTDQNVKYEVKDEVVKFLTPLLCDIETKEDAVNVINNNLDAITQMVDQFLCEKGFSYKSEAKISSEYFPTRTYNTLTLVSDVYDALIINLGSGTGDNWWCVVYPPMCFVGDNSENVIYKSKIQEIIENFFKK